jgi:general secretion pathway protein K
MYPVMHRPSRPARARGPQRGAALLLAMLILTLVATLSAGMVWQQQRAVQVEAAERARAQAGWILSGALDWARLILREDARSGGADHLGEPWAVPLAEARLSSFLAADRDDSADTALEAFLSGSIVDAQSRWNLRNLLDDEGKVTDVELATLQRLCDSAGAPAGTAERIAAGMAAALGGSDAGNDVPLAPRRLEQLTWLGVDAATVRALRPLLVLLPQRTALNLNTASAVVLAAVVPGLDAGSAERLVRSRERTPLRNLAQAQALMPEGVTLEATRVGVASNVFEVSGLLRLDDRVLAERSLVERRGQGGSVQVNVLWRERYNAAGGT